MANGFRVAGTLNEFLSDLEILKNTEHSLIVWQNDARGKKNIFDGKYQSFTQDKDKTIINIKLDKNYTFEKDNPVYIFEKDKGILFKGRYEYCINCVLNVLADNRVFLREKRIKSRFYFNYTKVKTNINITIEPDKIINLSVNIRDISPEGFAFRYDKNKSKIFSPGMQVELANIGGIELPRSLAGELRHISNYKDVGALAGSDTVVVGVKFTNPSKLIKKVIEAVKEL